MNAVFAYGASVERTSPSRAVRRAFFGIAVLLFTVFASATVLLCAFMSEMGGRAMPGGWTLSMLWMRMPDQTWLEVGAVFLGMWTVMMAAMMLPSLALALWRCAEELGGIDAGRTAGTAKRMHQMGLVPMAALIGAAYLFVWIALGIAVFFPGIALAGLVMHSPELARAVPIGVGLVVLTAGALQFTPWKAHHLALCRELPCSRQAQVSPDEPSGNITAALRCGLRLGIHCSLCSAGAMAILLALGLMDLRVMTAVTAAITLERIARAGERVAHVLGAAALVGGFVLVISAA